MNLPEPYATTERFKEMIRACKTEEDLKQVSAGLADDVRAHEPSDPAGVAQLRNLVVYQRMCISLGWVDARESEGIA